MATCRAIPLTHNAMPTILRGLRYSSSHHRVDSVSISTSYTRSGGNKHKHDVHRVNELSQIMFLGNKVSF